MKCKQKRFLSSLGLFVAVAGPVYAHAAEQGFILLLPTDVYATAGTLAVVASMLLTGLLKPGAVSKLFTPRDVGPSLRRIGLNKISEVVAAVSFAMLIYIGFFGPTDPQANLLPLALWTLWWMLAFVIQAAVFDIWKWINPFVALSRFLQPDGPGVIQFPKSLSIWPAVIVFICFNGFVLADTAPNDPDRLAAIALGYWAFTTIGMTLFGRDPWLRQVECFTVLFDILGKMRAISWRDRKKIGLPGWQTFDWPELDLSHATFILVILASGSFDGLYETFWWLSQMGVNPLEYPGRTAMFWKTVTGYGVAIAALTTLFAVSLWVGAIAVGAGKRKQLPPFQSVFTQFSIALLPIAIGYHFAHYFVTFLVQVQYVVATIADPLAAGWNLFGLGSTRVKVGFLAVPQTVKIIWITQAGIVVLSHILAVLIGHKVAEMLFSDRREIVRTQLGLSLLMVVYTIFGLWLLASPKVG